MPGPRISTRTRLLGVVLGHRLRRCAGAPCRSLVTNALLIGSARRSTPRRRASIDRVLRRGGRRLSGVATAARRVHAAGGRGPALPAAWFMAPLKGPGGDRRPRCRRRGRRRVRRARLSGSRGSRAGALEEMRDASGRSRPRPPGRRPRPGSSTGSPTPSRTRKTTPRSAEPWSARFASSSPPPPRRSASRRPAASDRRRRRPGRRRADRDLCPGAPPVHRGPAGLATSSSIPGTRSPSAARWRRPVAGAVCLRARSPRSAPWSGPSTCGGPRRPARPGWGRRAHRRASPARPALAIANRRLLLEMHGMAVTDPRTGLANSQGVRRRPRPRAGGADARGGERPSSIFDLDNFKGFNDRHGHAVGDEALRAFAGRGPGQPPGGRPRGPLRAARSSWPCSAAWTQSAAARRRPSGSASGPRRLAIATAAGERATISGVGRRRGGAAARVEAPGPRSSPRDSALYAAKATGRNRVVMAWDGEGGAADAARPREGHPP